MLFIAWVIYIILLSDIVLFIAWVIYIILLSDIVLFIAWVIYIIYYLQNMKELSHNTLSQMTTEWNF